MHFDRWRVALVATVVFGGTQPDTFPSFESTLLLESTSETSANVSIGDVNGDGHLDTSLRKAAIGRSSIVSFSEMV